MSLPAFDYYFKPGKLMKYGRKNPGILIVDRVYGFQCNGTNKAGTIFNYVCNERLTIDVMSKAKVTVSKLETHEDEVKYILYKVAVDHSCTANLPLAIAEEMRFKMKETVRQNPHNPVGEAIKSVRVSYSEQYDDNEDLFDSIMAELGPDRPLLKQLLRVRHEIIGKTPQNKNDFYPEEFLKNLLNVSTWIPTLEKDISVMEPGENPYEDRQIGVRKKQEWVGKKCASCAKGFNRVSKPLQCFTCDSYTHPKPACMVVSSNESQYLCKKCDNSANRTDKVQKETRTKILTCEHCDYSSTLSFNMKRHIQRNHRNNKKDYAEKNLSNLLEAEGLSNLKSLFQKEDISLQMLLEMDNADFKRMTEDLGISWGQKYRIEKLVEKEKKQCSSWH